MGNLPSFYLRGRLSARCEEMSEGAGEGFSASFEVLGGIAAKPEQVWRQAGTISVFRHHTKLISLPSDITLLMLDLYTVLHIRLNLLSKTAAKMSGRPIRNLKCLSLDSGGFNNWQKKKKRTFFVFCISQTHARVCLHIFPALFTCVLWGVTPGRAEGNMNQAEENVF